MQLSTHSVVDVMTAFTEVEIVETVPGGAELNSSDTPGIVVVTLSFSEPSPKSKNGG